MTKPNSLCYCLVVVFLLMHSADQLAGVQQTSLKRVVIQKEMISAMYWLKGSDLEVSELGLLAWSFNLPCRPALFQQFILLV